MDKRTNWTALVPQRSLVGKDGKPLRSLKAPRTIGRLPEEAYIQLFYHLPPQDVGKLARTCRKVAAMATDERIWTRKLAALDFKGPVPPEAQKILDKRAHSAQNARSKTDGPPSALPETPTRGKTQETASPAQRQPATFDKQPATELNDGFGDFVDLSRGPQSLDGTLADLELDGHTPEQPTRPTKSSAQQKSDDLLMLFDDEDMEDIGLATASPAKKPAPAAVPAKQSLSLQPSLHSASPAPSRDLFVAYFRYLLPFYISLQSHTTSSLVFSRPSLTSLNRAQLLSTLSRLLKPQLVPSKLPATITVVRRNLQSASDYFEASLLGQFERAAQSNVIAEMKECAEALWELNGGLSVFQVFINKIPLFYDNSWNPLRNLTKSITPEGETVDGIDFSAMDDFMNHVLEIMRREGTIMAKVFPASSDALVQFAERISFDVLDDYIVSLLSAAEELSPPLFQLTTAAAFAQCSRMTDLLLSIEPKSPTVTREKLQDIIFRLFEQHMSGYLREEGEWAKKLLTSVCEEWDRKLAAAQTNTDGHFLTSQNPQQAKRNVLAGFTKALLLPVTIVPKTVALSVNAITYGGTMAFNAMTGTTTSKGAMAASDKLAVKPIGTTTLSEGTDGSGSRTPYHGPDFHTFVSIDTAVQLIQSDRDCLKRVQTFAGYSGATGRKVKSAIEDIFVSLCQILSEHHLQPGFRRATDQMSKYQPAEHEVHESVMPLVQFFELVHVGDTILQMIQVYYDREMTTYVDKNDFLSAIVREKKKFENKLDEDVASGLNAGVNILMTQAEYILQTQQDPRDFCPDQGTDKNRRQSIVTDIEGPTPAAKAVVECLRSHCDMLRGSTDKAILEVFHQEVGLRLHGILLKHLKKSIVSMEGGFQVIADLNLYTAFVTSLKLPAVTPYFVALKMAANVFIIDSPKDLGVMARDMDRYEGTLRIEDIMEMVQCRTDWKRIEREVEKEVFGFKAEDCTVQ